MQPPYQQSNLGPRSPYLPPGPQGPYTPIPQPSQQPPLQQRYMQPPMYSLQQQKQPFQMGCAGIVGMMLVGLCIGLIIGYSIHSGGDTMTASANTENTGTTTVATMPPATSPARPATTHAPVVVPTQVPMQPPTPASVPTQPPAVPVSTPVPAPTSPPIHTGVNGNPWGYDFTSGNKIFDPPADFCGPYFACVTTFWKDTNGYVSECANGLYTHSGGISGECSRDGGKGQILYSH